MNVLLNDGRNERAREASGSGPGWECVGVMVLLRLMAGGLEERPRWSGQGPRERREWDGISLSPRLSGHPRCSALAGASADDRRT
jgi:hypothetical protein